VDIWQWIYGKGNMHGPMGSRARRKMQCNAFLAQQDEDDEEGGGMIATVFREKKRER